MGLFSQKADDLFPSDDLFPAMGPLQPRSHGNQGGDRWVKFHEESLDFHPRFFPVFEEKREN